MKKLNLYNTLEKRLTVFQPIDSKNVRIYACGPTVYDFIHIGNARPLVVFDVLVRLLRICLLYTSPSPRDRQKSRMPSSA